MLGWTAWPSLRRAARTVFSTFSLPLLLLAILAIARILDRAGLMALGSGAADMVALEGEMLARVREQLGWFGARLPLLIDVALVYLFLGNAAARAERDELMAVDVEPGERLALLREAFVKLRSDLLLLSVPRFARGMAIRALWPLVLLYRLRTPFVVEGPGPAGIEISTSVPRSDLGRFVAMVREHGVWDQQTVYDHRQVALWQLMLAVIASMAVNLIARLF